MPRFFFILRGANATPIQDKVGKDLPDHKAARAAAERFASRLEGETQRKGEVLGRARFEVIDEAGRMIDSVPLVAAAD